MAQSQNSKVDFSSKATWFAGLTTYGDVLVGDKAFEFYNEKNPEDFVQIPWDEVDYVAAEVLRGTKTIPRFAIFTKANGKYAFSTRDNKAVLRAMRAYVPEDRLQRSPDLVDVLGHGIKAVPGAIKDIPQDIQELPETLSSVPAKLMAVPAAVKKWLRRH